MKKIIFFGIAFLIAGRCMSQSPVTKRPRLIVGIVVDQMRYDYLYKYWDKYSSGGIKRLVQKGYSFENAHYNYVPTYTGPGHAAIYTGTTPSVNGIVGNNWYDRELKKRVYVAGDSTVQTVGSNSANGKMSPVWLLSSTITDELESYTKRKAKVIGISVKDRGSILPAGHAADAAYWYDPSTGTFISSTYYMQTLPAWVTQFNERKLPDIYLGNEWNTLLPISSYTESTADDVPYEVPYKGETKPVFPHSLKTLRSTLGYGLLSATPWGNTFVTDFALETIKQESMGKDEIMDFLAVSYSSTDYVGHQFGPDAIETEDTYLRLDLELQRLFDYLDKEVGKGEVLVFLTADHGAMSSIGYMQELGIPTGFFDEKAYKEALNKYLAEVYGPGKWVSHYENLQVYLDRKMIAEKKMNSEEVQQKIIDFTREFKGVSDVVTGTQVLRESNGDPLLEKVRKGYSWQRSGDVVIILKPGWMDEAEKGGTTHGSPYSYDTHIPVIFMGTGIPRGRSNEAACITDIAPTLAYLLGIMEPNGCTGHVLYFRKRD